MVSKPSSQISPSWESDIPEAISTGQYLPVGMGRSYGDVGLVSGNTAVSSLDLNRLLAFNNETGVLTCEPGVLLRDIQEIFVKRGWMLPVTPGTAYVSVGGAVANDVHGKDHHFAGTFGDHVLSFTLVRSNGDVLICSPQENSGMFRATIGGLGLTGFIAEVSLQLKQVAGPYFDAEAIAFTSLGEFFQISKETEDENWQASVAWFDCSTRKAGRGSFTRGNVSAKAYDAGSEAKEGTLAVPFTPPISLINKASLDLFNTAYFHLQKSGSGRKQMHYREFYYPLDGVQNWNRIYGPRGFFQYQSVVPMSVAAEATEEMLSVIRKSRQGSFLAVLKTFANREPAGLLSFARHGVTLALDFPNRGEKTEALMQQLDRIVLDAGGTLNPSKDARMSRELFAAGYPNFQEFKKYRDPNAVSDFSRRVFD
jgi:FAD/FMN-containing dehydrogenase